MKKRIALLLALVLTMGLSVSAFAGEQTDMKTVTVTKSYKLVGEGSSPAETFTLQQVGNGVVKSGDAETAPALGKITAVEYAAGAATAEGAKMTFTITLPTYDTVGIYEYKLKEVEGTTAGVTYFGKEILLRVTVINDASTGKLRVAAVHTEAADEEKTDVFENTYSAGKLNITKTVTGNLGDKSKYFKFTVTLTGEQNKKYADNFAVTGGSDASNPKTAVLGSNTFYLKDGDSLTIDNLPYGVTYSVVEDTYSDYTTTKEGDNGKIEAASATAAFTNDKSAEVDTGINLDNMPFIILFAAAAVSIIAVVMRKRRFS